MIIMILRETITFRILTAAIEVCAKIFCSSLQRRTPADILIVVGSRVCVSQGKKNSIRNSSTRIPDILTGDIFRAKD